MFKADLSNQLLSLPVTAPSPHPALFNIKWQLQFTHMSSLLHFHVIINMSLWSPSVFSDNHNDIYALFAFKIFPNNVLFCTNINAKLEHLCVFSLTSSFLTPQKWIHVQNITQMMKMKTVLPPYHLNNINNSIHFFLIL